MPLPDAHILPEGPKAACRKGLWIGRTRIVRVRRACAMPRGPRKPLPSAVRTESFTVAQGYSFGLGQGRMRGADLARPFRGIRAGIRDESEAMSTAERRHREACAALLVALPEGAFFSHLTAARLWPLPLPPSIPFEPFHVSVFIPTRAPRRTHVVGHHVHDRLTSRGLRGGLPLVDPATLFCQLAAILTLPDLVAAGDALVLRPVFQDLWDERPWVPLRQLSERVGAFHGRGKQSAGRALGRIRPGAESRPESLLRLAIIDAGMPEPEVNVDVHDSSGRFIGRGDLVYRRWRVIVEYDGDQHRTDTRQFDKDVLRLEGFARAGWTVVRVVGRAFFGDRAECLRRVDHALTQAGWHA